MVNQWVTMQSEELGVRIPLQLSTSVNDMTFSEETPSPRLDPQITQDDKPNQANGFQFDPIKLEADIELDESPSSDNEDLDSEKPPSDESIRTWLQRISQMQTEIQRKINSERVAGSSQSVVDLPVKLDENVVVSPSRVMKYQDLPYMGEMTLDNSKPRRGRKPKKADICHLIYKNYGTIFPGTPNPKSLLEKDASKKPDIAVKSLPVQENLNRSDVQNRIISSLLERRLTQESKRSKETHRKSQGAKIPDQSEPLNLCIRDLNQLKIRLLKKDDLLPEVKTEVHSDDEVEFVHESHSPSDRKVPNFFDLPANPDAELQPPENGTGPGGYVYWPNAGVFIHPMALQQHLMYYQRLAANNTYTVPSHTPRPPSKPSPTTLSELRKLAPKHRAKKSDPTESEPGSQSTFEQKTKRNAPHLTEKTPPKRKRSAIFIPPIPPENQTNPATEVSICKFKFTGGAKPSLQEKKMLSVDSGGNFRYYSGTGDKSMRGYEFFPRETLQQQIGSQGSSTGAFLQASGEKIFPGSPVDFPGKQSHSEFLLTPEIQPPPLPSLQDMGARHKKRKSRKSLQREKLEQTFKEKGFLIQTQQLESAEGATYCKFRQLRKFTRYLFRSWKDYLPGNVRELQEGEKSELEEVAEQDLEGLSRPSSNGIGANDV